MSLTESKSNLARLLAEEDLIVEQRKGVSSAFFDTKSRLLVIPTLKEDLSSDVVDLFISHEVGHALFTPVDWAEQTKSFAVKKSIINVVEDARIEKMVKQKFPGLRIIYSKAYKNLMGMDFFGISQMQMENINLIDKINLFFKIGFHSEVTFNEIEQKFVDKVENVKTFEEVLSLSKEIQDYMKEKYEQDMENGEGIFGEEFDDSLYAGDYDVEYDEDSPPEESEGKSELEEMFEGKNEGVQDSSLNQMDSETEESRKKDILDQALESLTANNSEENLKELFSDSRKQSIYIDLPDIKIKDYVVDYSEVYTRLKSGVPETSIDKTAFNRFKRENASIVSYLIKEFQLKKNAEGRKKIKISKTGEINLNKIFAYKTSDDIFKRNEIVPKSQSHGLVFFLDWSGSMDEYINDTVKQLVAMMLFCKKLNIPFEVYAFTTQYYKVDSQGGLIFEKFEPKLHEMILYPVHLMNLFSSRMSNNQFIEACNYLLSFNYSRFSPRTINKNRGYYNWEPDEITAPRWFLLGNTPLNHSIILSKYVVEEFKSRAKVQKINAIFMTDGDSHGIDFNTVTNPTNNWVQRYGIDRTDIYNIYLRDRKTKITHKLSRNKFAMNETNNCVDFLKKISDFNVFGFRLVSKKDFRRSYNNFVGFEMEYKECSRKFNKENCLRSTSTSFDEFYLVKANSINEKEETIESFGEKETQVSIAKKFQKALEARVNNRVFLKKFIEFIS